MKNDCIRKNCRPSVFLIIILTLIITSAFACNTWASKVLYYGHRGYTNAYPENTLIGLKGAVRAGFDGVEFDVHSTSGGSMMVFHDSTLSRVCGCYVRVSSVSEKNRAKYPIRSRYGNQLIPTLEEAIAAMSGMNARMYIHLKAPGSFSNSQLNEIAAILQKYNALSTAVVFCSNIKTLKKLQKKSVTVGYLDLSTNSRGTMKNLKKCIKNKIDSFVVFWPRCVNSDIIKKCSKNGILVGSYKVQNKQEAKRLKKIGVNFMFNYGYLMK